MIHLILRTCNIMFGVILLRLCTSLLLSGPEFLTVSPEHIGSDPRLVLQLDLCGYSRLLFFGVPFERRDRFPGPLSIGSFYLFLGVVYFIFYFGVKVRMVVVLSDKSFKSEGGRSSILFHRVGVKGEGKDKSLPTYLSTLKVVVVRRGVGTPQSPSVHSSSSLLGIPTGKRRVESSITTYGYPSTLRVQTCHLYSLEGGIHN